MSKHPIEPASITEHYVLDFGIHKGLKLANVPADYLVYVYENNLLEGFKKKALKNWVRDNLEDLQYEINRKKKYKR